MGKEKHVKSSPRRGEMRAAFLSSLFCYSERADSAARNSPMSGSAPFTPMKGADPAGIDATGGTQSISAIRSGE
jgi:hypothetical protein